MTEHAARTQQPEWRPPPRRYPAAAAGEAHVWRAFLGVEASTLERLWRTLTGQERARADRFRFPADRRSFIVARGTLRGILARYLGMDPGGVPIREGRFGKPELAVEGRLPRLAFNISHSHDVSLYAVTAAERVGVDVERVRPVKTCMQIAERFFSPTDVSALRAIADEAREEAFLACWTRKEAYVKALGEGLARSLSTLQAPRDPARDGAGSETTGREAPPRWSIHSLAVGPRYVGALAVDTVPCRIRHWTWSH